MTDEPDSKPGRRPPTIELKAEEVEKSANDPRRSDKPGSKASGTRFSTVQSGLAFLTGLKPYALSALAGAIGMAVIFAVLWIKGIMPAHESGETVASTQSGSQTPAASAATTVAETASTPGGAQQPSSKPQPLPATDDDAALAAQVKSLGNTLDALNHRLDAITATTQGTAKKVEDAVAAANAASAAAQKSVPRSDLNTLANRVATLEAAVKALADAAAHSTSGMDDRAARLTVATEALRAAVERGAPYQAELDTALALGADRAGAEPLEAFAAGGVPSADALARDLVALVPALRAATATAHDDASFLGRLKANAQQLVRITPVDAPAGDDPASVVARIDTDATRADIATALADIAALPDGAKSVAARWVKEAQARDAAIAASRQISAAALAALSGPPGQ